MLEALTTVEVIGHYLGPGGLLNSSLVLYKEMLMSRKNCFSPWILLLLCFLFISCNVKHARSQSSLKHSDRGSYGSIPVSFGPVNGGPRMTTTKVCRLPSLANFTPSEELHATDIGFDISNSRGQEVDSPIKNRGMQVRATVNEDGTLTPGTCMNSSNAYNKGFRGYCYNKMLLHNQVALIFMESFIVCDFDKKGGGCSTRVIRYGC